MNTYTSYRNLNYIKLFKSSNGIGRKFSNWQFSFFKLPSHLRKNLGWFCVLDYKNYLGTTLGHILHQSEFNYFK